MDEGKEQIVGSLGGIGAKRMYCNVERFVSMRLDLKYILDSWFRQHKAAPP